MKELFNKNLFSLFKGEVHRSVKYKILPVGVIFSFLWLVLIFFLKDDSEAVITIVPLLIYMDTTIMSIMLVGASLFFEKSEGSVVTLFVTPTSTMQILISKIISAGITGVVSGIIVGVGALLITDVELMLLPLLLAVFVITMAHSAIGLTLAILAKDFPNLLVKMMIYMLIFAILPILAIDGLLPKVFDYILIISPSHCASILLQAAFTNTDWYMVLISIIWIIFVPTWLIIKFVAPRFQEHMMRG